MGSRRLPWLDVVLNPQTAPIDALPVNPAAPVSAPNMYKEASSQMDHRATRSSRMPDVGIFKGPTVPARTATGSSGHMSSATPLPEPENLSAWVPIIQAELTKSSADVVGQKWLTFALEFHERCVQEYRDACAINDGEGLILLDKAKTRLEVVWTDVSKILTMIEEARRVQQGQSNRPCSVGRCSRTSPQ